MTAPLASVLGGQGLGVRGKDRHSIFTHQSAATHYYQTVFANVSG